MSSPAATPLDYPFVIPNHDPCGEPSVLEGEERALDQPIRERRDPDARRGGDDEDERGVRLTEHRSNERHHGHVEEVHAVAHCSDVTEDAVLEKRREEMIAAKRTASDERDERDVRLGDRPRPS